METELIRPVVRIGNSSGVILPKSWLNQEAKIELITKNPSDILSDVLKIIENKIPLNKILGVYLTGSYARNEENAESDIDILIITNDINKSIKKGRYEILVISKENLENMLNKNIMPILPMLKESKPLLNETLIEELKKTKLNKKNIKWHIDTTKFAIGENKFIIETSKKLKSSNIDDGVAYSLVLRLRGVYIIDCLRKNKLWSNNELIDIIKKITGSKLAYERYKYIKDEKGRGKEILPIIEAERLLDYVKEKNNEQEKWLKEKNSN
jgi:predicted nucleotidyltransferase